ncbi:hypothetical protein CLOM621_08851 [Clostridium sp. M62/1]|nr:hypothetical protein CLOM621_08851 [Clostridium sp. M62/1]
MPFRHAGQKGQAIRIYTIHGLLWKRQEMKTNFNRNETKFQVDRKNKKVA